MNDAQKHSKIEMEILSHEKEMMHAAQIRILNEGALADKINYIKSTDTKKAWNASEILTQLNAQGLNEEGFITIEQVEKEMITPNTLK